MKESKNVPRAETGVMEFENDYPGVFIRGDNAAYFAMSLRNVLDNSTTDPLSQMIVHGMLSLLESSDIRTNPTPQRARLLPIEDKHQI